MLANFIRILITSSCILAQNTEDKALRQHTCLAATDSEQSELNSFLWTLRREGGRTSYLFGTIHVPYTRVWDYIPQSTKNAFRFSDRIYFELDLTNGETAAALSNCQLLPEGQHLSDILPKRLYKRLTKHMEFIRRKIGDLVSDEQRHMGLDNEQYAEFQYRAIVGTWTRMRPVWLMLMLNSLTETDVLLFGTPVLDLYLSKQAVHWGKKTAAIERVEEQCAPLNQLNSDQVIFALEQTLNTHEEFRLKSQRMPANDELITHYNCGDLKSVLFKKDTVRVDLAALRQSAGHLANYTQNIEEYFQMELLYKRNSVMAQRIQHLLTENPNETFFFAFGAGHFLGDNSVIEYLTKAGISVEHTPPEYFIQNQPNKHSEKQVFTHMDTNQWLYGNPYSEAIRKLQQANLKRRIRHGKGYKNLIASGENPQSADDDDEDEDDFSREDDPLADFDFSNIWIEIDDNSESLAQKSSGPSCIHSIWKLWVSLVTIVVLYEFTICSCCAFA